MDPAVYQTEKLEKENAEITAVLDRQVPKLSTFPWINLSQPEKFKFTDLNGKKIGTIIDKAESLSINTREVFSKQLSVFSGTVVNVENKNRKLRVEYKEVRKTHEENRRQAQNRQRSRWAQNKNRGGLSGTGTDAGSLKSKKSFWKNFFTTIPTNPKTRKPYNSWQEYHDEQERIRQQNSS